MILFLQKMINKGVKIMKAHLKLAIGLGIAAAATTAIVIGVARELKAIRNLTIDVDDLSDDVTKSLADELGRNEEEEAPAEEEVGQTNGAEETPAAE
jgi:hypothetical protein